MHACFAEEKDGVGGADPQCYRFFTLNPDLLRHGSCGPEVGQSMALHALHTVRCSVIPDSLSWHIHLLFFFSLRSYSSAKWCVSCGVDETLI